MSIHALKLVFAKFWIALSSTPIGSPDLDIDSLGERSQAAQAIARSQELRRDLAIYANLTEPNL